MSNNFRITVVVTAQNGVNVLSDVVAAVKKQTRLPDSFLSISLDSDYDSALFLEQSEFKVCSAAKNLQFAEAVNLGIKDNCLPPLDDKVDWVWLLHDDCVPKETALAELIVAVEKAPSVGVAGVKQLVWPNSNKLVELGTTVTRWYKPINFLDKHEEDQGQYDNRTDVLVVSSAGMLVRKDVWDKLEGFDTNFVFADINFCWRARLAGHRVVSVPKAVVFHAQTCEISKSYQNSYKARRELEIFVRMVHAPFFSLAFHVVFLFLAVFFRSFFWFVVQRPKNIFSEFGALNKVFLSPAKIFSSRRKVRKNSVLSRKVLHNLRPKRRELFLYYRDFWGGKQKKSVALSGFDQKYGFSVLGLFGLLTVFSLFVLGKFFGSETIVGGALVPINSTISEILENTQTYWLPVETGMSGVADPFNYVLLVLSFLFFGNTQLGVIFLLILALPLAGLSMWSFAAALTSSKGLRFWSGIVWAAAPSLFVALGQGRLNVVVVHILLPLIFLGVLKSIGGVVGQPSLSASALTGLLFALVCASFPGLFFVAVFVLLVFAVFVKKRAKFFWVVLLPSFVLLGAYFVSVKDTWQVLFASAGVPLDYVVAPVWQLALGLPSFVDFSDRSWSNIFDIQNGFLLILVACVLFLLVFLLAMVAFFVVRKFFWLVFCGWFLAFLGLFLAWVCANIVVAVSLQGFVVAWAGVGVSVFVLGVLLAAVVGADSMLVFFRGRGVNNFGSENKNVGFLNSLVGLFLVFSFVLPLFVLSLWSWNNFQGDDENMLLESGSLRTLPALAAESGLSKSRSRTLVLSVVGEGEVVPSIVRGQGKDFTQTSTIVEYAGLQNLLSYDESFVLDEVSKVVTEVTAAIVSGSSNDVRKELFDLGVGYVLLQHNAAGVGDSLVGGIESSVGFSRVSDTEFGWLWVVEPVGGEAANYVSRVRLVSEGSSVSLGLGSDMFSARNEVAVADVARRVVLAEHFDVGWQATLAGQSLSAVESGWNQSFVLPEGGGQLHIFYVSKYSFLWRVVVLFVFGVVLCMSVPLPRMQFVRDSVDENSSRFERQIEK